MADDGNDGKRAYDESYGAKDDEFKYATLKSAQTLAAVAVVGSAVSLVIGGVFLSVVALICGIVSYSKVKAVAARDDGPQTAQATVRKVAIFGIVFSVAALVLNAVSLALVLPALMDYLNTGDMDVLMASLNGSSSASSAGTTSVWD